MEFIFRRQEDLDNASLTQGDVIAKSAEVIERISQAHQYYAQTNDYTHFVVLTQSCDLVRRQRKFKAPYVTIAAAKPFSKTIDKFFSANAKPLKGSALTYFAQNVSGKAKQLIEKHINNTEPDFFFLPKAGHPNIPEDLVVFLRLTIALRPDHYDTLANAKVAELADVFQAKLGWLTGNIYSRVATPDLDDRGMNAKEIKASYYDKYIPRDATVWLSPVQAAHLKKRISEKGRELARELTAAEALAIIENDVPEDEVIIARNIVELLRKNKLIDTADEQLQARFERVISNEPSFKAIVKQVAG